MNLYVSCAVQFGTDEEKTWRWIQISAMFLNWTALTTSRRISQYLNWEHFDLIKSDRKWGQFIHFWTTKWYKANVEYEKSTKTSALVCQRQGAPRKKKVVVCNLEYGENSSPWEMFSFQVLEWGQGCTSKEWKGVRIGAKRTQNFKEFTTEAINQVCGRSITVTFTQHSMRVHEQLVQSAFDCCYQIRRLKQCSCAKESFWECAWKSTVSYTSAQIGRMLNILSYFIASTMFFHIWNQFVSWCFTPNQLVQLPQGNI